VLATAGGLDHRTTRCAAAWAVAAWWTGIWVGESRERGVGRRVDQRLLGLRVSRERASRERGERATAAAAPESPLRFVVLCLALADRTEVLALQGTAHRQPSVSRVCPVMCCQVSRDVSVWLWAQCPSAGRQVSAVCVCVCVCLCGVACDEVTRGVRSWCHLTRHVFLSNTVTSLPAHFDHTTHGTRRHDIIRRRGRKQRIVQRTSTLPRCGEQVTVSVLFVCVQALAYKIGDT
jgi:hypothetical protein